jgi:hypothetical protein
VSEVGIMLAVAVTYASAIAGCVYLTLHGHPVVGVIVLIAGLCVSFKTSPGKAGGE